MHSQFIVPDNLPTLSQDNQLLIIRFDNILAFSQKFSSLDLPSPSAEMPEDAKLRIVKQRPELPVGLMVISLRIERQEINLIDLADVLDRPVIVAGIRLSEPDCHAGQQTDG